MDKAAKMVLYVFIASVFLVVSVFFMCFILILIPTLNNIVFCVLYGVVAGFLIGRFMARLIIKDKGDKN